MIGENGKKDVFSRMIEITEERENTKNVIQKQSRSID
jgi:hypothetical protein